MTIEVPIQQLSPNAKIPSYAHANDAGMDVYALEDVMIMPGETVAVRTGIAVAIPEGYEIQLRPRSGISLHTMLRIPNSPGTIDPGFRDEVKVIMHNASCPSNSSEETPVYSVSTKGNPSGAYLIKKGDRIAQMVCAKTECVHFIPVSSLKQIGEDRKGGFGSTGISSHNHKV